MKRLAVDRIRCDAHGQCAELLPELISLDDWGYPIVRGAVVPAELVALAKRAVAACPVLALRLDSVAAARSPSARRSPTRTEPRSA